MSLSIKTRQQDARTKLIALSGEVDYATAQNLRAEISAVLTAGGVDEIVADLSGVTFLDSTGLGTLVVARRICDDVSVRFRVRNANPFVARLFNVVGVAEQLGVPVTPAAPPARAPRPRLGAPAPQVA